MHNAWRDGGERGGRGSGCVVVGGGTGVAVGVVRVLLEGGCVLEGGEALGEGAEGVVGAAGVEGQVGCAGGEGVGAGGQEEAQLQGILRGVCVCVRVCVLCTRMCALKRPSPAYWYGILVLLDAGNCADARIIRVDWPT